MASEHRADPARVVEDEGGALWRVTMHGPKGNVLDAATVGALTDVFARAGAAPHLKAVCLSAAGPHFSFGSSIEEHLPDRAAAMLDAFHRLLRTIADAAVPVLAAVRGQCLGGGLELAAFCHRVFAASDARFGQPEITLGVFAPVASLILPERIGRGAAEHVCLSGDALDADSALALGLVDEVADDPVTASVEYARRHLLRHSARSLRHAVRAVRHAFHARLFAGLSDLERAYLDELMATEDAVEGVRAFLEKRAPRWRDQ